MVSYRLCTLLLDVSACSSSLSPCICCSALPPPLHLTCWLDLLASLPLLLLIVLLCIILLLSSLSSHQTMSSQLRVCVCIKCMHLLELLYEGFLLLYSHLVQVALVWWMPMWCSGSVLVLTGMRLCVCGFVPKQFILQKLIHNDSSVHCLSFEDLCEMCLVLDKNKVFHIYLKKSKSLRLKIIILTTFGQQ